MTAFYNEIDPFMAGWLRYLIAAGHIAPGVVDERDIRDIGPNELVGFTQCHFFAGIGGWSKALRLAGWADDRPIWTGSCPCQPFSAAGKRGGFADQRHLWPAWFHLVEQCRPVTIFGEQVASRDGLGWFDLVSADLEGAGYACGAVDLCAAGVGAPHIRQRLWFVAHAQRPEWRASESAGYDIDGEIGGRAETASGVGGDRPISELANAQGESERESHDGRDAIASSREARIVSGCGGRLGDPEGRGLGIHGRAPGDAGYADQPKQAGGVDDAAMRGRQSIEAQPRGDDASTAKRRPGSELGDGRLLGGFWADAEWIACSDGKARPIEPGTFPLAARLPRSMGKLSPAQRRLAGMAGIDGASLSRAKAHKIGSLRGYGNAINPWAAAAFIRAAEGVMP